MSVVDEKKERFLEIIRNLPKEGTIIKSKNGEKIPIFVDIKPGHRGGSFRLMFTNCKVDEEQTGWYLTKEDNRHCLKLLVLPDSQEYLIKENGGGYEGLVVDQLRVCGQTKKGTALLCEVVIKKVTEGV